MIKKMILFISLLISVQILGAESPFVRFPSLNNDGSLIAFSYQGDIWTVPSHGGKAYRLTIHEAYDSHPVFSKDGKKIAFQSERFGNDDLFVMPSSGGTPTRLTYHSTGDNLYDFTNDGDLIFTTNRIFRQIEWDTEIHSVNVKGGTPERFLNTTGDMPAVSPNGNLVAFARGWGRITREKYRGSANYEIWIYNRKTDNYYRITNYDGNDFLPKWGNDNTLYFISPRSGFYNIHRVKVDDEGNTAGSVEQVTSFEDDGIRNFSISADGKKIVLERQVDLYLVDSSGGSPQKVNIDIAADYRFDPFEWKTYTNNISGYKVSPDGKYSVLEIRGEIFITENDKEKSKTVNVSNHPFRDQHAQWLSDSTLVFCSDREGQFDLYLLKSADAKNPNLFKSFRHEIVRLTRSDEDESWPVISPDKKKIAYEVNQGKLVVADISPEGDLSNEVVLLDGWAAPGNVCWSPDSKWLAYSLEDLNFNQEIYIHSADGSKEAVNISMHPRGDSSPFWSKDGKKLAFVSDRNNMDGDIWFVWLNKNDWEKTKSDWKEGDDDEGKKKNNKKDKKDTDSVAVEPIVIDFDNIYQRLVQVTSLPGNEYSPLVSKDGEKIYFVANNPTEKGNDLYSIKWDGTDIKLVTKGGSNPAGLSFDSGYKYLYMLKRQKLSRLNLSNDKEENIAFEAKIKVDYVKEREQIFEEAWRALDIGFYDPDFHGNDWKELKEKYKPWCLMASTSQDFSDLFNYMLGEVNASHMGFRNSDNPEKTQNEKSGLLGVEVEPLSEGVKVIHVVMDSPADKEQSKINEGDVIVSVNGTAINSKINFYSALINTADEKVLLEVKDSKGKLREVIIRPVSSLSNELYDEWVNGKKELVDKYSKGRLGYLHIRGMSMPSFERFERELTARGLGKDGIVIDVRYNGGGWTTDYLMTILNYKQHAYTVPRGAAANLEKEHKKFRQYYPLGERLPFAAWTKPSIALCNQNSYSNAEIFSHAYKNLGIGTLVGVPTFGAVISTGARLLIDGSFVRMPGRGWYAKATDANMDFYPAVPDIIVYELPADKSKGEDPQLKKAVEELLKQLDQ
ncbi:MAG: PD40 domain-containing protein [Melioribacteraceae bacterium]|nr:PD40 domain-containing protein [Melioribacteraceae bacterium]